VVVVLFGLSGWFALGVRRQRQQILQSGPALTNGALVTLASVVDGDTVIVRLESGDTASVRLLGIKAFAAGQGRDPSDRFGHEAMAAIERKAADKPLRVLLNSPPKDKYGRYLALLFVDEEDLGLDLVRRGLALVYTVYPFQAMALYLQEQESAHADRRGLWADAAAAKRAELLVREWRAETP
jgi:endonuclease YncB( thermonuclease family)